MNSRRAFFLALPGLGLARAPAVCHGRKCLTPLVLTCPATTTVETSDPTGAVVVYAVSVTGGRAPYTVTGTPASGSVLPIGNTVVSVTATSRDGHVASCVFEITMLLVSTAVVCPGGSVTVNPGSSIQTAVDANPGATTFCLGAGTHTSQAVVPKSYNTFLGQPGCILDGQNAVNYAFYSNNLGQVNVTIRGLEIKNYLTPTSAYGAISGDNVTNWVVTDCVIHDNVHASIRAGAGTGWQVLRNTCYSNGHNGISGYQCHGAVFQANRIYDNNPSHFSTGYESGIKVLGASDLIIRGNYVHDNFGNAQIWSDSNLSTVIIEDNIISGGNVQGIWHEVGYAAKIRRNTVTDCGTPGTPITGTIDRAGIAVTNSPNVEISYNSVSLCANYITFMLFSGYAEPGPEGTHVITGANVHHNIVDMSTGASGTNGWCCGMVQNTGDTQIFDAVSNNDWDFNDYTLGAPSTYWFWAAAKRSQAVWQGTYLQDLNSTF